jgi:RNA polymerase sigma-70 factor (ECF subfamily)
MKSADSTAAPGAVPMGSGQSGRPGRTELDAESAEWVTGLGLSGTAREQVLDRLHGTLLRIARGEVNRRAASLGVGGPELDDLAHQAAADALLAITRKVGEFRGESRFTTWAYKFVIFEVSGKMTRHFWRTPRAPLETEEWERLPDRFGLDPARESEWRDMLAEVRRAVEDDLTARQRRIFVALVLSGVPLDVLVTELGSNRNAIYKALFDARRKVRARLVANGYLDREADNS